MYQKIQKKHYEDQWKSLILSDRPGPTGWQTKIPAPAFLKFTRYLKRNKIVGRALDVGCGGGRYTIVLAKAGFNVFGIDFSAAAIKVAKRRAQEEKVGGKIHFIVGNVLRLKYPKNYFDIINDDGCLHHIAKSDWPTYLQNITRVLKPDGILRVKVFSANCNYYVSNLPAKKKSHWILIKGADNYTYFFNKKELKELFKNFKIINLVEKFHSVTKDKKFFYAIFKKLCTKS